jgi:multisubunit Na+/H+ antiporter MnhC subunit
MTSLLSMPVPFAAALVILAIVGAFSFLQLIALMIWPAQGTRTVRVRSSRDRQMHVGRRSSDLYPG